MRKIILISAILLISVFVYAQKKYALSKHKVKDNIYKIEIGTVNLLAFVGKDGILLSDCGFKHTGEQLDSVLLTITDKLVKYVINTHWHHDHSGGNFYFNKNAVIISQEETKKILSFDYTSEFWQEEYKAFPEKALPDITFKDKITINFSNEDVELIHLEKGHTKGDIAVYFKKSNIVHLSDHLFSFGFPAIDFEKGGSVEGFANNLQKIIEMSSSNTIFISGHGPDFNLEELKEYKNMLIETLTIIEESIQNGLNMEEIKKKEVLKDYEKWANGYFSCNDWIEIVYSSLAYKK